MFSSVSRPPFSSRSMTNTWAWAWANVSAIAAPIPEPAPVTSAVLFFNSNMRAFRGSECGSDLGVATVGALELRRNLHSERMLSARPSGVNQRRARRLGQQFADDFPVHVREPTQDAVVIER